MENEKIIEKALASRSKVKILNFLSNNVGIYSANYICKYADISPRSSLLSLKELIDIGIVTYKNSKGYQLNYDNFFVREIIVPIFTAKLKQLVFEFKKFIVSSLESYIDQIFSILVNKDSEIMVVLNIKAPDDVFTTLAEKKLPSLKKEFFSNFSYTPNIMIFKYNFIPHDILDSWMSVKPTYGSSLKSISVEESVSTVEIKKALEYFQLNK